MSVSDQIFMIGMLVSSISYTVLEIESGTSHGRSADKTIVTIFKCGMYTGLAMMLCGGISAVITR